MAATLLDGFTIVPLRLEDDVVQERMDACYRSIGMPKPWRHPLIRWLGFAKDGIIPLVVGIVVRDDNSIELTDFYPAPTREGVRAGHVGLRLLQMLVEYGVIPEWLGGIVTRNAKGLSRALRHFGCEEIATVVRYRKREAT